MKRNKRIWIIIISILSITLITCGIVLKNFLSDQLRELLQAELSRQIGGNVTIHNLNFSMTRPMVELEGIKLESQKLGIEDISIVSARAHISPFPIFFGTVFISRIDIGDTRIQLSTSAYTPQTVKKTFDLRSLFAPLAKRPLVQFVVQQVRMPNAVLVVHEQHRQWQLSLDLSDVESRLRKDRYMEFALTAKGELVRLISATKEKQYDIEMLKGIVTYEDGTVALQQVVIKNNFGEVVASGQVFPEFKFNIHSNYDLVGVAALLGEKVKPQESKEQLAGKLNFDGKISGNPNVPHFLGKLSASTITFAGNPIQKLDSELEYENRKIKMNNLTVQLGQGKLTGVAQWAIDSGNFSGNLNLTELAPQRVEAVLQSFLPSAPTIEGTLTGNINVQGVYFIKRGVTEFQWSSQINSEFLNLRGKTWQSHLHNLAWTTRLQSKLGLSHVEIEQLELKAEELQLNGSGNYRAQSYHVDLNGSMENLWQKLHPSLEQLFGKLAITVKLAGGRKSKVADVSVSGEPLRIGTQDGWNLRSRFIQDQDVFRCTEFKLTHPAGSLQAKGAINSATTELQDVQMKIKKMPADFVIHLIPAKVELRDFLASRIDGTLSGAINMRGAYNAPSGSAELQATHVHLFDNAVDQVQLKSDFTQGLYRMSELKLEKGEAEILAEGEVDANNSMVNFKLNSKKLTTHAVQELIRYIPKSHPLIIQGKLFGPWQAPDVDLDLQLLSETQAPLIKAKMVGNIKKPDLKAVIQLAQNPSQASLSLRDTASLKVTLVQFEPLTLANALGHRLHHDASLMVSGDMELERNRDKRWSGLIALSPIKLRQSGSDILTDSALDLRLRDNAIYLASCTLRGPSTQLLCNAQEKIEGSVNLSLLKTFFDFIPRSEGRAEVAIHPHGPINEFDFTGTIKVRNAIITFQGFPTLFENIDVDARLAGNKIIIDQFRTTAGNGQGSGSGDMEVGKKWEKIQFNLAAKAKEIPVRIPEDFPGVVSGNVQFTGPGSNTLLAGKLNIDRVRYTKRFDWRSKLLDFSGGETRSPLSHLLTGVNNKKSHGVNFDLAFNANEPVIGVKNNVSDILLQGNFSVLGKFPRVGLQGNFNVHSGKVTFYNHIFNIDSGTIKFNDPGDLTPYVDVYASARIREYAVSLNIHTVGEQVQVDMNSTPPLGETDLVALLTVGSVSSLNTAGGGGFQQPQVTEGLAVGIVSGTFQDKVERIGVLDTFQVVPDYSQTNKTSELRLMLGKDLTQNLGLIYSTDLYNAGNNQEMRLRQVINNNFSISGKVKNTGQPNENVDVGVDFEFGFDF